MSERFSSDPSKFSGIWFCIHILAIRCKNNRDMDNFIAFMNTISETLTCGECREELKNYMRDHNLEYYKNIEDDHGNYIGAFRWSHHFHNSVNMRLGKRILRWENAYHMYTNHHLSVCRRDC